ncbi:MAG: DUF4244 domain-containing protein [Acidimicrobiia bacterium]|jgi:Flp pilus assembly pilin Flp
MRFLNRLRVVRDDAGQTTAEYALVILGAAAIATLLLVWAKGSGAIGSLFDEVIGKIL